MLVRAEVSRRAEKLNSYIKCLKQKVYEHKYKEAQAFLKNEKDSVNNSCMAPYDPNLYLLDSLKAKADKLILHKAELQEKVGKVSQRIEKKALKKGLKKGVNEQVIKAEVQDVGVYASRIALTLNDAHKVDYEQVSLETDFFDLKIVFQEKTMQVRFREVVNFEGMQNLILLSWCNLVSRTESFLLLQFPSEEQKEKWEKIFKFCKMIEDSRTRKRLFIKPQAPANIEKSSPTFLELNGSSYKDKTGSPNNESALPHSRKQRKGSTMVTPKQHHSSFNKKPGLDRIRRQSEFFPFQKKGNTEQLLSDRRKVSADLTSQNFKSNLNGSGYFNERKINRYKSQKSFDQKASNPNSNQNCREREKSSEDKEGHKMAGPHPNSSQEVKPKAIFINNDRSVHWIEEEHEDEKYRESKGLANQVEERILNIFEESHDSKHISEEEPVEGDESPTIPYNMRKGKNIPIFEEKPLVPEQASEKENGKENGKEKENGKKGEQGEQEEAIENQEEEKEDKVMEKINLVQAGGDRANEGSENLAMENEQFNETSGDNDENQTEKFDLKFLIKGIMILKCAENGWGPHLKKLFLSFNQNDLCWMEEPNGKKKSISLLNIEFIRKGHWGKGINKHIKKIIHDRCLIIKGKIGSEVKLLQFYLEQPYKLESLDEFVFKLKAYWEDRLSKN